MSNLTATLVYESTVREHFDDYDRHKTYIKNKVLPNSWVVLEGL